jgi:Spy/CpxP family protein refolding chaperone
MNERNRATMKIWGAVLLVFVLGCITGGAISGFYLSRSSDDSQQSISMRDKDEYFDTLRHEVNLTPEQETKMSAVLDEMRDKYKSVCAEVRPRYFALREDARLRMREVLSPEQQKKFDTIVTQDDCKCPEQKKEVQ